MAFARGRDYNNSENLMLSMTSRERKVDTGIPG